MRKARVSTGIERRISDGRNTGLRLRLLLVMKDADAEWGLGVGVRPRCSVV
jgi:hypothetical protein